MKQVFFYVANCESGYDSELAVGPLRKTFAEAKADLVAHLTEGWGETGVAAAVEASDGLAADSYEGDEGKWTCYVTSRDLPEA